MYQYQHDEISRKKLKFKNIQNEEDLCKYLEEYPGDSLDKILDSSELIAVLKKVPSPTNVDTPRIKTFKYDYIGYDGFGDDAAKLSITLPIEFKHFAEVVIYFNRHDRLNDLISKIGYDVFEKKAGNSDLPSCEISEGEILEYLVGLNYQTIKEAYLCSLKYKSNYVHLTRCELVYLIDHCLSNKSNVHKTIPDWMNRILDELINSYKLDTSEGPYLVNYATQYNGVDTLYLKVNEENKIDIKKYFKTQLEEICESLSLISRLKLNPNSMDHRCFWLSEGAVRPDINVLGNIIDSNDYINCLSYSLNKVVQETARFLNVKNKKSGYIGICKNLIYQARKFHEQERNKSSNFFSFCYCQENGERSEALKDLFYSKESIDSLDLRNGKYRHNVSDSSFQNDISTHCKF